MFVRLPPRAARIGFVVAALVFAFATAARAEDAPVVPHPSLAAQASASVRDAATNAWRTAEELTASALDLIGIRYRWGGTAPETGLDCSGLVQFVFQQVTGVTLPRSAKEMSRLGDKVALADLKPGDLVFFNTRRFAFSHVGIYVGDNQFIHAPRRGREVEIATIDAGYWQKHFNGARRLVGVLPEMIPMLVGEAIAAPLLSDPAPALSDPAPAEPQP